MDDCYKQVEAVSVIKKGYPTSGSHFFYKMKIKIYTTTFLKK